MAKALPRPEPTKERDRPMPEDPKLLARAMFQYTDKRVKKPRQQNDDSNYLQHVRQDRK